MTSDFTYVQIELPGLCMVVTLVAAVKGGRPQRDESGRIETKIHVECVPFSGKVATELHRSELLTLRSVFAGLHDRVGQDVEESFALHSDALRMRIHLTQLGQLRGEITVDAFPPNGPSVHMPIYADQTYLPLWIRAIDSAFESIREWDDRAE